MTFTVKEFCQLLKSCSIVPFIMGWIFVVTSDDFHRREKRNSKRHHTSQALDTQQPYTSAQKAPSTLNT